MTLLSRYFAEVHPWDPGQAEHVFDWLQERRDEAFSPGNDKVWGEGNWVRCADCPDGTGWPSYHHKDFHEKGTP